MKNFFNSEISEKIAAADVAEFIHAVKALGLNAGKKPVQELFDGKRDEVAGFYLVEGTAEELVIDPDPALDAPAPLQLEAPAPKAVDADAKPEFTKAEMEAAIAEALAKGLEVQTKKLTPEPTDEKPKAVKAKVVVKNAAPKGKIKAVRKGTKIAVGLEMLVGGTTEAALMGTCGDDPVDFCNRRVTKRGYGIKIAEGVITLVFPEGVAAVVFSG